MSLLETRGISKRFGGVCAINNISMHVNAGEVLGVIGPNGAGKTSFFNALTGLVKIDEGQIFLEANKKSIHRYSPHRITAAGIARTFQNLRLFRNMSVVENVAVAASLGCSYSFLQAIFRTKTFKKQEKDLFDRSMKCLGFVGLEDKANQVAGNLAYGEQKKLEIARALCAQPKLLLLDEPVAGMNPTEKNSMVALIRKIRSSGVTIVLIEHDMKVVMPVSDRVMVIDQGQKLAEGTPEQIQADPRVIEAYLGESDHA